MTAAREYLSAAAFIADSIQNKNVYYEPVMGGFMLPAIYFPPPKAEGGTAATGSYSVSYDMEAVFFAESSRGAFEMAEEALEAIASAGYTLPVMKENGDAAGENIRILSLSAEPQDKGICRLRLSWRSERQNAKEKLTKTFADTFVVQTAVRDE